MKKLIFALTLSILALPAFAASSTAYVKVNGLVCDFCARALEKVLGEKEEVENIQVDLTSKIVTIDFEEDRTLSDGEITGLIADAGYDVEDIRHEEK